MELVHKDIGSADEYERINGDARRKKCSWRLVAGIGVATLLLVVIVVAVFAKRSSGKRDPWVDLPPLEWDGDCPAEPPECPESFRGVPPPLLLVSMDGFRADYLSRGNFTPTLRKLARCGVRARYLSPVYPSKTFPNHYTQVTGLYPSSHGIVDNSMHDPDTGRTFKLGHARSFDPEWWQREPLWVTAEKQGKKTATFFWPGSDVEINGTRPSFYKNYNLKVPFETRVLQVLEWLDLPRHHRPAFLTLYFNEPDSAAHVHGTGSRQVEEALWRVDRMVTGLFSGLQARNLTGCVNVFIASDHGMADIDCDRVVDLREYINVSDVQAYVGTFGRIRPLENTTSETEVASSLRCRNPHLRVFEKANLPVRMHYSENARIEPLILDTDSGWTIFKGDFLPSHKYCTGAAHGYDNLFPDMKAFFTAIGPSLKKNATVDPFLNVELYELMCELIDIIPNPNNGTRGSLHHFLKAPIRPLLPGPTNQTSLAMGMVAKDAAEYAKREAMCPCRQSRPQVDPAEDSDDSSHLPFGLPSSSSSSDIVLFLRNTDYVMAYDERRRLAEWAAFTLSPNHQIGNVTPDVCWTGDARVSGASCSDHEPLRQKGLIQWPLYPPTFSSSATIEEATYVTNSVPVSLEFATILGGEMWRWLNEMEATSHLHVITGPAYATRMQPRMEVAVPSHLFVIATSCSRDARSSIAECPPSELRASAFLLPTNPYPDNCEDAGRVIERNVARVVDVEGVTGLEFFTGLPTYDALRLRTALPPPHD